MKVLNILVIILFLSGLSISSNAQKLNSDSLGNSKKVYLYTIESVTGLDQLSDIQQEFEALKFVQKVKLNYKGEKPSKAQFMVYVNEPMRTSEEQIMFQPTDLKKIIINHNATPHNLVINDY